MKTSSKTGHRALSIGVPRQVDSGQSPVGRGWLKSPFVHPNGPLGQVIDGDDFDDSIVKIGDMLISRIISVASSLLIHLVPLP